MLMIGWLSNKSHAEIIPTAAATTNHGARAFL
jgi:hypothetical protein